MLTHRILNKEFIMNWVGGARRRVGLQNEKKTQKEYFERKRQNKKIRAFQSPEKKNGISQDLLALHTVNIAYSGMPFDKKFPEKRYVRKVNIDQSKLISREIQEVELPHSPIKTPSLLNLEETKSCLISSKLTGLNQSSHGKGTSRKNPVIKAHNDPLLSPSFRNFSAKEPHQPHPSFLDFSAKEFHQPKPEQLFSTTTQNQTNDISALSLLDNRNSVDRNQRIMDRYQAPSFLPSMDLYHSSSPEASASPPRHHAALPESRQIPRGSTSDVYNNIERKWREHRQSVHTETYIEERQHCWQMATSQRSYISNTSPFITTLHQLQESQPYGYDDFVCPESPEEYVAIPLGSLQQLYMPSAQTERVRREQELPDNTRDHLIDKSTLQAFKQTSDFWQIPVYGDFVKEMKMKQSKVADGLMSSTDQSRNIEIEEDTYAKKYSRENRKKNFKEKCETPLMSIQKYNEDQEDPVFNEQIYSQMTPECGPCSKLVNVSVQVDLKASVSDANTSPIFWPQNDQVSQCDEEEFQLNLPEEELEDSLEGIIKENRLELFEETSNNFETCYQLRSRSALKATNQK